MKKDWQSYYFGQTEGVVLALARQWNLTVVLDVLVFLNFYQCYIIQQSSAVLYNMTHLKTFLQYVQNRTPLTGIFYVKQ